MHCLPFALEPQIYIHNNELICSKTVKYQCNIGAMIAGEHFKHVKGTGGYRFCF